MLMMEDVNLGLKRPATPHFTIVEKVLIVIGEVYLGLRTSTHTNITHFNMVD